MYLHRCVAKVSKQTYAFVLLGFFISLPIHAEQIEEDEIIKGLLSSFDLPFEQLFQKKNESEWENLLEGFSGNLSANAPTQFGGNNQVGGRSAAIYANVRYQPLGYWFGMANFIYYLQPKRRADWEPNFTYSFGYDDWHPYTLSLVYSNYQNNNIIPNKRLGKKITDLEQGVLSLGWKFKIPEPIEQLFMVDESSNIGCKVDYNVNPSYLDVKSNSYREWKHWLSLNCKYNIWNGFYIEASSAYYPDKSQMQPWDRNFSYNFGYVDPSGITIQYRKNNNSSKLTDGSLFVDWAWKF